MEKMNRRKFLKTSALTGGALVAGSLLKGKNRKAYGATTGSNAGKGEIAVPASKVPVAMEADVVVVGAGSAGFGAALAAARHGMKTVLIEYFGGPGGMVTTGYNTTIRPPAKPGISTEFLNKVTSMGQVFNGRTVYPNLTEPVLETSRNINSAPGVIEAIELDMLRKEKNITFMFRTPFVDTINSKPIDSRGDASIEAIIVTNASGLQAVRGKIFIDTTGVACVCRQAGVPCPPAGTNLFTVPGEPTYPDGSSLPLPCPLCFMYSGVDMTKFQTSLAADPGFANAIAMAVAAGDLPPVSLDGLFQPEPFPETTVGYARKYKFHPSPQIAPMAVPGNLFAEVKIPYKWGLRPGENGADASLAEVTGREFIFMEWNFLKKYIPGFEKSVIVSIAPMMDFRDRSFPEGEHTMTYDDLTNQRTFPDAVIQQTGLDPLYNGGQFGPPNLPKRSIKFDVPYRAFTPLKIDNLLVAGDCLCHEDRIHVNCFKAIPWSIITGEIAGVSASMAVEQGISAKQVQWTSYYTP